MGVYGALGVAQVVVTNSRSQDAYLPVPVTLGAYHVFDGILFCTYQLLFGEEFARGRFYLLQRERCVI